MCAARTGPHVLAKIIKDTPDAQWTLRINEYVGSLEKRPKGVERDYPRPEWATLSRVVTCDCGDLYTLYGSQIITAAYTEQKASIPLWPENPEQWPEIATRWAASP